MGIENPNPIAVKMARDFMLAFVKAFPGCQPSDFDAQISGQYPADAFEAVLTRQEPWFNRSIFNNALSGLVTEGLVDAENLDDGWHYYLSKTALSSDLEASMRTLITQGKCLAALKMHRERTGSGLKEGHEVVMRLKEAP